MASGMVEQRGYLRPNLTGSLDRRIQGLRIKLSIYTKLMGILALIMLILIMVTLIIEAVTLQFSTILLEWIVYVWLFQGMILFFYFLLSIIKAFQYFRKRLGTNSDLEESDRRIVYEGGDMQEEFGIQHSNILAMYYISIGVIITATWPTVFEWSVEFLDSSNFVSDTIDELYNSGLADLIVSFIEVWTNTRLSSALNSLDVERILFLLRWTPPVVALFVAFRYFLWLYEKVERHPNPDKALRAEVRGFYKITREVLRILFRGELWDEVKGLLISGLGAIVVTLPFLIFLALLFFQ